MSIVVDALRFFIKINKAASQAVNRALPKSLVVDGNQFFLNKMAPRHIKKNQVIHDIGGGSQPFCSVNQKDQDDLFVIGLDIDEKELKAAPQRAYDKIVVADLCRYRGDGDCDIVICQSTLEHVPDTQGAIHAITSILKPGGKALIFAPSRNAFFARLNLILPQHLKEKILYFTSPEVEDHQGFPAKYDKCTPREMEILFAESGLMIEEKHYFWMSTYFFVFFPAFLLWRLGQGLFFLVAGSNAAETFAYVVVKQE